MPTNTQKPWGDTLRTSTPEVFFPSAADFTNVSFNKQFGRMKLLLTQTVILRLRNRRLKPKFRFPVRALHVHVHTRLIEAVYVNRSTGAPELRMNAMDAHA